MSVDGVCGSTVSCVGRSDGLIAYEAREGGGSRGSAIAEPDELTTDRVSQPIVIADLGRFQDIAGAFWTALESLRTARAPFRAVAGDLAHTLGDPRLAAGYDETYRAVTRTLDAMESCFEEYFEALATTGRAYEKADDAVARRMC